MRLIFLLPCNLIIISFTWSQPAKCGDRFQSRSTSSGWHDVELRAGESLPQACKASTGLQLFAYCKLLVCLVGYRLEMEDTHTLAPVLDTKQQQQACFAAVCKSKETTTQHFLPCSRWACGRSSCGFLPRQHAVCAASKRQQDTANCGNDSEARAGVGQAVRGKRSTTRFPAQKTELPAETQKTGAGSGAAAVFAFVTEQAAAKRAGKRSAEFEITVGHAGDCRAVLLRHDGSFESLTRDHVPTDEGERERIEAAGGTVEADGRVDAMNLSRAIGDSRSKRNDKLPQTEQKIIALPDITTVSVSKGDILLLASDGLVENEKLSDEDKAKPNELLVKRFRAALAKSPDDPARALCSLLDQTLAAKSQDNMTAVCVQLGVPHDDKQRAVELVAGTAATDILKALKSFLETSGADQAERIRVVEKTLNNEVRNARAARKLAKLDAKIEARQNAPDPDLQVTRSMLHVSRLSARAYVLWQTLLSMRIARHSLMSTDRVCSPLVVFALVTLSIWALF